MKNSSEFAEGNQAASQRYGTERTCFFGPHVFLERSHSKSHGSPWLTLCDPVDCSLPGSIHEIFQARILEWVAVFFSRGSSRPRDRTWVSCIAGRHFTVWANPCKDEKKKKWKRYIIQSSHGQRKSQIWKSQRCLVKENSRNDYRAQTHITLNPK